MAVSTKILYVKGNQLTLEITSDTVISFNVTAFSLDYEVQDEDNPFNYTIGGIFNVETISNDEFVNVTKCVLKYGNDIWFQGVFKSDQEKSSLEQFKYRKQITFSDVLSEAQDKKYRKRLYDQYLQVGETGKPERLLTGDAILEICLDGEYDFNLTSSIESNSTLMTLLNTEFDNRTLFNEDLSVRTVIGEIAFSYASRAQHVNGEVKLVDVTKADNLGNTITIDKFTPDSRIYYTQNLERYIEFAIDNKVDNMVFNQPFMCNNTDGSGILGFYTFPTSDDLTQSSVSVIPTDRECRFSTDGYGLVTKDGLADFLGQKISCSVEFDVDIDETQSYTLNTRVIYYDENNNQWALRSDGTWEYMGVSNTDPTSDIFKPFAYTNSFVFSDEDMAFNEETGNWTLSHNFDVTCQSITGSPTPSDNGSYFITCALPLRDFAGGTVGVNSASFTSASLNSVRGSRPINAAYIYESFEDVKIQKYTKYTGLINSYAYTTDVKATNGIMLVDNNIVGSGYLSSYINNYNKVNYTEIIINTGEKITPLSKIVYNGVNYFVQKMQYDLFNGICTLTIKECNDE